MASKLGSPARGGVMATMDAILRWQPPTGHCPAPGSLKEEQEEDSVGQKLVALSSVSVTLVGSSSGLFHLLQTMVWVRGGGFSLCLGWAPGEEPG